MPSFATRSGQLTFHVTVSLSRRIVFEHFAGDVLRTVGRAHDEAAAELRLHLHRKAEKIFPAELGRGQRLPHFFRRGGDVDGVDGERLELSRFIWRRIPC